MSNLANKFAHLFLDTYTADGAQSLVVAYNNIGSLDSPTIFTVTEPGYYQVIWGLDDLNSKIATMTIGVGIAFPGGTASPSNSGRSCSVSSAFSLTPGSTMDLKFFLTTTGTPAFYQHAISVAKIGSIL